MAGSQTAVTRGSSAAFRAISGPIPDGSPTVMATIGLLALTRHLKLSQFEQQPVRDDLRACVAVERRERAIDGRVSLQAALRIEGRGEFLELFFEIRVRDHGAVGTNADDSDVPQQ